MWKLITFSVLLANTFISLSADNNWPFNTGHTSNDKTYCDGEITDNNCKCQCNETATRPPLKCYNEAKKAFAPANFAFGTKLLYDQVQSNPGKNVMISCPVTTWLIEQVAYSSKSDARTEVMKLLNLNTDELVECYYQTVVPDLLNIKRVGYTLFGKVYSHSDCPVTDHYKTITKRVFSFEPQTINFTDPESADKINNEASCAKFKNTIDCLLKPNDMETLTGLVLVSAESFKGNWIKPFDPSQTKNRDFFVSYTKTIQVNTMYQKGVFDYTESLLLNAQILRMYYEGGEFSFVIILPFLREGLKDVLNRMHISPELFNHYIQKLKPESVEVYLPKFIMTTKLNMKDTVQNLGKVTKIFKNETAGLEKITSCSGTYISKVIVGARLQVDETGMDQNKTHENDDIFKGLLNMFTKTYTVRADHPFIYCLYYKEYLAFCGVYLY